MHLWAAGKSGRPNIHPTAVHFQINWTPYRANFWDLCTHVREISAPVRGGKIWPSKSRSNRCRWVGALLSGNLRLRLLFSLGFLSASAERNCRRSEKTGGWDCRSRWGPMSRRRRGDDDRRQARMGQAHGPTCICLSLGWRVPWRWR